MVQRMVALAETLGLQVTGEGITMPAKAPATTHAAVHDTGASLGGYTDCIPGPEVAMQEIKRHQVYRVRASRRRGLVERLRRWLRRR